MTIVKCGPLGFFRAEKLLPLPLPLPPPPRPRLALIDSCCGISIWHKGEGRQIERGWEGGGGRRGVSRNVIWGAEKGGGGVDGQGATQREKSPYTIYISSIRRRGNRNAFNMYSEHYSGENTKQKNN